MINISQSKIIPYTPEQMYALVNDIEAYPAFLPWCDDAKILARYDAKLTASVSMAAGKLRQSFTTENTLHNNHRIDMRLVSGPFKYLTGYWQFEPAGERACHITINLDFEFSNKLIRFALDKAFSHIVNTLIESFTQRAHQIYGDPR